MSDERLREAERRWRETGAVEDEARYLLERVRAGDLAPERLELAARCGHRSAARALGRPDGVGPGSLTIELARELERHGHPLLVAASAAIAAQVLPVWTRQFPEDHRPARAIAAARACAPGPTRARALEAREAGLAAGEAGDRVASASPWFQEDPAACAAEAAHRAAACATRDLGQAALAGPDVDSGDHAWILIWTLDIAVDAAELDREALSRVALEPVVAWALTGRFGAQVPEGDAPGDPRVGPPQPPLRRVRAREGGASGLP